MLEGLEMQSNGGECIRQLAPPEQLNKSLDAMKLGLIVHHTLYVVQRTRLEFQHHEGLVGYIEFAGDAERLRGFEAKARVVGGMTQHEDERVAPGA